MTVKKHSSKLLLFSVFVATTLLAASTNRALSAANHIVISQVQTNGSGVGTTNDEFVELYNPTDSAVDLAAWKLRKKTTAQAGLGDTLVSSLSGTIAAHSYFLIAHPDYSGSVAEDFVYTSTSSGIAASNNTVLLYNNADATPIDKVGMGTAQDNETAAAPNPENGGSLQRKLDDFGAQGLDTDNNSTDFELLATSSARNSLIVVTPTPTATATATPTPTESPTGSPSASPTPTSTPIPSETPSPTPTSTPSPTPTVTPTETPSPTATPTTSPTPTESPTPTVTSTASPTPTMTASPKPTETPFGQVIGVFNFPRRRIECRVFYIFFRNRLFSAAFPTFICMRV